MDHMISHDNQMIVAILLGAFHGLNPAMGWLFAVFLAIQRNSQRVLFYALIPISAGQLLGDGLLITIQTIARFHLPIHIVHTALSFIILLYGLYRLLRYYRHFKWSGGLNVGYLQLVLWSFLASSTHGSGLLLAPFILNAHSFMDILPLWIVHEMGMVATMAVIGFLVYRFGIAKFRNYIVNFELIWAILLIGVGIILILMNGQMGQGHIH